MASRMRLAIPTCPTDYPLILRSRDSGVPKDAGPERDPGLHGSGGDVKASSAEALARLLTMRI